jgi:ABC-type proline/glycine betaine transport system substrate-binding protein
MRLDLNFQDDIPAGWTPLEATVIYKALDELGVVRLGQTSTPAVSGWEVAGMLLWALDGTRDELRDATDDA